MPVERLEAGGEEHESAVLARQISEIGICALRVKKVFLCEKWRGRFARPSQGDA